MTDDERGFLGKLLEQPNSDLTRLVYADWLDEQGTPDAVAKAEFLRLIADAELAGRFPDRAKELSRELDPQWLAVVSKLPVENCWPGAVKGSCEPPGYPVMPGVMFDFECPKRWEELTPTEENGVRFCGACQKTVHYCHDRDDLRLHANLEHCVAVELGVPRRPGDLTPAPLLVMGRIRFEPPDPADDAEDAARIRDQIQELSRGSGHARRRRRRRREQQEE